MLKNMRGDTIIEVMFSLSIVGMVLGFSYASASRSSSIGQEAYERTEATKLAESQIELMKSWLDIGGNDNDILKASPNFCMKTDGTGVTNYSGPAAPAGCTARFFTKVIIPSSLGDGTYEYIVRVSWDSRLGSPKEVALRYRLAK